MRFESADELRPHCFEALAGRGGARNAGFEGLAEIAVPFADGDEERFGEQGLARTEVIADGGEADSGGGRDIASSGALIPFFQEDSVWRRQAGLRDFPYLQSIPGMEHSSNTYVR
jgi:hypothetical protein